MTALYVLDRGDAPLPETLADALVPWRRERFERLKNSEARQESLCAGLLFSYAMQRSGVDPAEPVSLLPKGKPIFTARRDVLFSLSHSGRYVLCAVSGKTVGADVQQIRPMKLSIARRFHPDEQSWLLSLPEDERQAGLFRVWTRKEAWVKAVSADRMLSLSEADVLHGLPGLCFQDYALPGGCAAALCGEDTAMPEPETVALAELLR